ncbi:MAG: sulfite exporter TauE/SafE family protein [Candidatus Levybacteria bacterium]|nr:sulfite exporter TauE/SafE family protein [Candidatus Levybacteria bacterium]
MEIKLKKSTLKILIASFLVFLGISFFLFNFGIKIPSSNIGLGGIFLTGLLTGGLTCLAVQGGLLAATIAQREEDKLKEKIHSTGSGQTGNAVPILAFLGAKLVAYTILGFLLGMLGSVFQLSITTQVVMQTAVAIFMIGTALNILNVHPIFRYFVIQPPKFLTRIVRNQSKSKSIFAPLLLGAFTVFIPCGTTQAMMALAIGSGSPLLGGAILFAFVLGTSPVFFTLGYFATKLGDAMHQKFMKFAAFTLIILSLFNLNGALSLAGMNPLDVQTNLVVEQNIPAVEEATIAFTENAYSPSMVTVKAGSHVKLNLINNNGQGCIQAFTIPKLGIQKIVRIGTSESIEFDAPIEKGGIAFMCSMGMYRGTINVI